MIEKQREQLRRQIFEIQSRKPTRRRYPEELRQAVCCYTREQLGRAVRCKAICQELSLSPATVKRWMQTRSPKSPTAQQPGKFRAVAVIREELRPRTENIFGSASCSMTSPAGYRVEGLCVEQIAYLLRELR